MAISTLAVTDLNQQTINNGLQTQLAQLRARVGDPSLTMDQRQAIGAQIQKLATTLKTPAPLKGSVA